MANPPTTPNRLSMEIDPEAINAIVRQTVNASIAAALQKQGVDFAGSIVNAILDAKVDNDGKVIQRGHYSYDRTKMSWFDYEMEKMLRDCAKKALSEFMAGKAPQIEAAMHKAFIKRTPHIVKALTENTLRAFEGRWGFKFDVKIAREGE